MQYCIVVNGAPSSGQAAYSALQFARAVIDTGHRLHRVFFYHDGVYNGLRTAVPAQDERDLTRAWCDVNAHSGAELAVCVTAALRRGVIDAGEAERYNTGTWTLHPQFNAVGLGQLVEAIAVCDRTITFRD